MATIANGASLSDALRLRGKRAFQVNGWTAAAMTFQAANEANNFADVYDDAGAEITVPSFSGARTITLPAKLIGVAFIKIRSGTAALPVNQGALRTITLVR